MFPLWQWKHLSVCLYFTLLPNRGTAPTMSTPSPPLPAVYRRRTCGECLSNSSQCAWCESAQACFYFAAYLTKYPYGECRHWYDR